jgi:uncharacterized repeat protein (TIGR01451 family)
VTLTDTLPSGVTFDSATPTQGTCSEASGTVECALGTIADAGSAGVEIKVTPQGAGDITNQATVTSELADRDSEDTSASAVTTVRAAADLSLTGSDSPDPVLAGEQLTYTLTAQNAGPQEATGVTLTDTLPAGVTFESATPTQGTCSETSGTVTCSLGALADEATTGVEIKVRRATPGTITNQAEVSSSAHDSDTGNNSVSIETTVDPAADLSLTKADAQDPVLAGELVTYTLTAHNSGPQDATGVTVTDTLPGSMTFDSATPSQGSCSESAGTVTCALGTLADEANATITIRALTSSTGTVTNEAAVSSELGDPNSGNNSASAETTVSATPVAYDRPLVAPRFQASLVPAYNECTTPNRFHGPPLGSQSCNPPAPRSSYLVNGNTMIGLVKLQTTEGTANPADDADLRITLSTTDVKNRTVLTDYTGELQGRVILRITDRANGLTGNNSATVSDSVYTFTVPCAATVGSAGSTCSLSTTADALAADTIREGKRTIWQLGEVHVMDGGADGDAETADNTVFLHEGLFIP